MACARNQSILQMTLLSWEIGLIKTTIKALHHVNNIVKDKYGLKLNRTKTKIMNSIIDEEQKAEIWLKNKNQRGSLLSNTWGAL